MEMLLIALCMLLTGSALAVGVLMIKGKDPLTELGELQKAIAPSEESQLVLREEKMQQSFYHRVLFPFAQQLFQRYQTFIPLGNQSWVRKKLLQAGFQKPYYQEVLLGIQILLCLSFFGGLMFLLLVVFKLKFMVTLTLAGFYSLAGYALPLAWVNGKAQSRQKNIQRSLPDFLDLLVIAVEAGLGLDMAIHKITEMDWGKRAYALREELLIYLKDVNLGKARKQALLDMADRSGVEDFALLVNALAQAFEMGNSMAHTLRVQSEFMRMKRMQAAEERANKIPVKMVPPIYIFLFPAIFVAIFGPMGMMAAKLAMQIFGNMGG